jgi:hypothetical protein
LLLLLVVSCDKTNIPPEYAKLKISLFHHFEGDKLELSPKYYVDEAGDSINVTDLKYYLSNITLISKEGKVFHDLDIFYVDVKQPQSLLLLIDSIPPGDYQDMYFNLGIDEDRNFPYSLPNTLNNINMIWPELMGGGYHFMKLEGQFKLNGNNFGYAFHLGKSKSRIDYNLSINKSLKYWNEKIVLNHDVSEWFKNPLNYDFAIHEPYSMSSDSVIGVLKLNGSDVFSF